MVKKIFGSKPVFRSVLFVMMIVVSQLNLNALPSWISGADKRWPSDKYLTGIGAAQEPGAAQDKARAEIAKVFNVAIEQMTVEKNTEASSYDLKEAAASSSVNLEQKTTSRVSDKIEGIEIAQVWYDKKEKLYWALAVLDKQKYGAMISGRILETESKISSSLAAAKSDATLSNLERLKYLVDALESLELKDGLSIRLKAIGLSSSAGSIDNSEEERRNIEKDISDIKQSTAFKVLVRSSSAAATKGDDENSLKLKEMLKENLVKFGFSVLEDGAIPDGDASTPTVEARFSVTPFVRQTASSASSATGEAAKDYWKYARWEGYFEVKDRGRVLVSAGASGSESNPDENTALKKAQLAGLKVIGDLLTRKFREEFGAVR